MAKLFMGSMCHVGTGESVPFYNTSKAPALTCGRYGDKLDIAEHINGHNVANIKILRAIIQTELAKMPMRPDDTHLYYYN